MTAGTKVNRVFVPGSFPELTFVDRTIAGTTLTDRVVQSLDAQGMMVALVGASKSGKTQLIKRALKGANLIRITGEQITAPEDLVFAMASGLGMPVSRSVAVERERERSKSGELSVSGQAKIVEVSLRASRQGRSLDRDLDARSFILNRNSVIEEMRKENAILFVDNFHYVRPRYLIAICQALRGLIEDGVRCCVAYVPHKKDMLLKGNRDLNNKAIRIDVGSWKTDELISIAELGFHALNYPMEKSIYQKLAAEACFSPQIMQMLCYEFCMVHNISEAARSETPFFPDDTRLHDVLLRTVQSVHFEDLVEDFLGGRIERRAEKTKFLFYNGVKGNFYTCLLVLLGMDPPRLSFSRTELQSRLRRVCGDSKAKRPGIARIDAAITFLVEQAALWSENKFIDMLLDPDDGQNSKSQWEYPSVVEFDASKRTLFVSDPSFLFAVRNHFRGM